MDYRNLHGTELESSVLTHQNLFSSARILQSVKSVVLHATCSDRDCLRYMFKNCTAGMEGQETDAAGKGKSTSGGGAEMLYILLSSMYNQLPQNFDIRVDDSDAFPIPSYTAHIGPAMLSNKNSPTMMHGCAGPTCSRAQAFSHRIVDHMKCHCAAALAFLSDVADGDITDASTKMGDAYLLEAVYLMNNGSAGKHDGDRAEPDDSTGSYSLPSLGWDNVPAVISALGSVLTEQLGDAFLRANMHKLAILSYESCLMIHIKLSTELDNKIYRKLSLVAQEAGEVRRSLFYNCIILSLSQADGNVNEFIYVSKRTAKLCLEVGEIQMAERFLKVSNLLHLGIPINFVKFEKINLTALPFHLLPHGLKIPSVFVGDKEFRSINSSIGLTMQNVLFCDSNQLEILLQLCDVLVLSNRHTEVVAICQVLVADQKLPFISRFSVLMKMASSLYSIGQFLAAEATLNSICSIVDNIVRVAASKMNEAAQSYGKVAQAGSDNERDNEFSTFTTAASTLANESHCKFMSQMNKSSSAVSVAMAKLKSREYILLRARTAKALEKYQLAIYWLDLLVLSAPAPGSPSGKGSLNGTMAPVLLVPPSTRGLVLYLMGRCYALMAQRLYLSVIKKGQGLEALCSDFKDNFLKAERCYLECIEVYKSTGDTVHESKACYRWTELYIDVLFDKIEMIPSSSSGYTNADQHGGSGEEKLSSRLQIADDFLSTSLGGHVSGLTHVERISRQGLLLSGECGSPMLSIQSMLVSAELALIQERDLYALNCWKEIYVLLSVTYLQPLASDAQDNRFVH